MEDKRIQFGNEGEELAPGKTENLSSSLHGDGDAARPNGFIGKQKDSREPDREERSQ